MPFPLLSYGWRANCWIQDYMGNDFEEFPIYRECLELIKDIKILTSKVKDYKYAFLNDQIRRSTSSILLNIAEGSGKWRKKDKSNFYRVSKGSAFESIAIIELFIIYELINEKDGKIIKNKLCNISKGIQNLIYSVEKRKF
jgi:four helix bundle protein